MASIDDLQGSGVYDDGKGKGGERVERSGPSDREGGGSSGPSDIAGSGSSGPSDVAGSGSSGPSDVGEKSEVKEVEAQGFGWSFDPTSD